MKPGIRVIDPNPEATNVAPMVFPALRYRTMSRTGITVKTIDTAASIQRKDGRMVINRLIAICRARSVFFLSAITDASSRTAATMVIINFSFKLNILKFDYLRNPWAKENS